MSKASTQKTKLEEILAQARAAGSDIFEPLSWQQRVMLDTSLYLLLTGSAGGGKALALDTPVLTIDGFRPMSEIEEGDIVYNINGLPVEVVAVTDVMDNRPCYEVRFSTGETVVCDAEHEWVIGQSGNTGDDRLRTYDTHSLAFHYLLNERPCYVPVAGEVEHPAVTLPVDPWLLGFLIGDGYMPRLTFSTADAEIVQRVSESIPAGMYVRHTGGYNYAIHIGGAEQKNPRDYITGYVYPTPNSKSGRWSAFAANPQIYLGQYPSEEAGWDAVYEHNGEVGKTKRKLGYGLRSDIERLGLIDCRSADKFIPDLYKYAAPEQRLELLRGLMDADGSCSSRRGRSEITVISRVLAYDIHEVACSLGIKAHIAYKLSTLDGKAFDAWRVQFTTDVPVFWLRRKVGNLPEKIRRTQTRRYIESVTPIPSVPVKCITVETGTYLVTRSHIPTHNSRVAYEKLVAFAMRYPGSNILTLRKELDDCARSVIPTLDDVVLPSMLKKGRSNKQAFEVEKRTVTRCYVFSNGSRIWWGGMRNKAERQAIRSIGAGGSLDFALMEEGIEFEEEDFDELRGRMRGVAAPWRQIMVATNPDGPLHWINRRLIIGGEASVHISSAHLNPHVPTEYVQELDKTEGIEGARLARGLWVEGTGLVIDTWANFFQSATGDDGGGNVSLDADYIPDGGPVVAAVDDGYAGKLDPKSGMFTATSHPRVFLLAQIRPTGQICVFHEDYAVKERYRVHIKRLKDTCAANGWPVPTEAHYDKSSATLKGELELEGFTTLKGSTQKKEESIKLLKERIAPDDNGWRQVKVHPRCKHLILEMSSWSMKDDVPQKTFDHGPDALRYMVWNLEWDAPVEGMVGYRETDEATSLAIQERLAEVDRIIKQVENRLGVTV